MTDIIQYTKYRGVLLRNFFKSTGGQGIFRPNWERKTRHHLDIARVFLYNDGTFRAYRGDGNPFCHGRSADELASCFGSYSVWKRAQ